MLGKILKTFKITSLNFLVSEIADFSRNYFHYSNTWSCAYKAHHCKAEYISVTK